MAKPCIYPTLRYADADAAIRWLTDTLGFRDHAVHRAEDGTVAHAELALGPSIIMLGQARDDAYGAMVGVGRRTDAIYVAVPDADAVFARVEASGVAIEKPPHDTDYGSREFACRDPEGNLWSVGTYWPTVADQI
ncbi:VOC family protein [Paracoccus sp. S3-43]|uniref:VOC family protein n=1 Tax=Paracoccus sp. S3-43 TaxID=3030011 RepID=UPI0023B0BE6D|nr:VOC family protein [Paracoccus sp. S3-43]WEF23313.1 VOC family protein [Paracoccus sp. S3-43]